MKICVKENTHILCTRIYMLRTNFISSYNLYFLAHGNGSNTKHIDISHQTDSPSGKAPVIVINSDAGDNGRLLSVLFFPGGAII